MEPVAPKVDFVALEHKILDFWEKRDTFNKLRELNKNGPRWSFLDGPITANNPMGVHHAWGRTYKDLYQRYHAMLGQHLRYQNGFDCQGLWVEVEVEKELGFKSKTDIEKLGVERFVELCKARVRKYSAIQTKQSIRLGYWMDWDNSYYTMSEENNYAIWAFLKKLHNQGLIYQGHDVMPWCPRCGAALSEHEIATEGYKELTHTSVYLQLPLKDEKDAYLLIWTTTPWTLSSNVMAAVHPDLTYLKVRQNSRIFYLLEARREILQGDYEVVAKLAGKDLLGRPYTGPFDELPIQQGVEHKVIPWEEVSEEEGTGIVHIAPGCGREDFELSRRDGFPVLSPIDEFGVYLDGYGEWTGRKVSDVGPDIIQNLKQKGFLYKKEKIVHRYPTCWRHGTELVFRLVDEWFISMEPLREAIMEVARQIRWIPDYGLERELDWLRNMGDWMISKKRYWGLALPIYPCPHCGQLNVVGSKEELKARAVSGWERFEGHTPHRPWIDGVRIACSKCGKPVERIKDVGNPWLDAGIVPYSTLHYLEDKEYWEKWFPADFIVESLPGQFRNWFYAILAMSTVMENRPPTKVIMGYALVKDEHGRDMHKSAGNAIWFDDAAEKMGVDVMRWMYARQVPVNNLHFGYEAATEIRRKLLTLWNTYSFFVTYARLDKFTPDKKPAEEAYSELDRWLLVRLEELVRIARKAYDDYQVDRFIRRAERFLDDLSNWYVRRSRRRFWKSSDDADKQAAYATLYQTLVTLIKLLAPVIPFLTEEMYQNLVVSLDPEAPESVHHCRFPEPSSAPLDTALLRKMEVTIKTVSLGRAARNKANLKVRQPLSQLAVYWEDAQDRQFVKEMADEICEELNIKKLEILDSAAGLINYRILPNAPVLGRKYGAGLKTIRQLLAQMNPQEVAQKVAAGESLVLSDGEQSFELSPDEVLVEIEDPENRKVITEGPALVILDTTLTPELIREGMARDFIRQVQNLRKETGFDVADRIEIVVDTNDELRQALEEHKDAISREILAVAWHFDEVGDLPQASFKLRGHSCKVGVKRH